jgi:hypothetical protein
MKPYVFRVVRLIDFLTFGLATALSAALSVWAAVTPGNNAVGIGITAITALGFSFVYAMILVRRLAFANRIAYVTRHGLVVMRSEFPVIRMHLEKLTEEIVVKWENAIIEHGIVRNAMRGCIVEWRKAPWTMHFKPGYKFMGLAVASGNAIVVGFREPLEASAFAHEIGHICMMHWKGDGSEDGLKEFAKKHDLPY